MKYTGAEIIVKSLEREGIKIVTGIPGGANLPIYDALYKSKVQHVLARHEQGAGFIAHGMARCTGKAAVCFATSGPGATNILTAVADAKLDSVPLIVITGQVATSKIGQDAFQEVDTYGLVLPITKHNFFIRNINELIHVIPEAFRIAESGRHGPVVIDVPVDIQKQVIEFNDWPEFEAKTDIVEIDISEIEWIAEKINRSEKPLLFIGGGINASESTDLLYSLSKKNSIPVTSTLMGLGCFPSQDSLYIGMLGMHGARYTNYILDEADLLISLGVRFDDRAIGKANEFCPDASIIHIDIDHSEIDKIKESDYSIIGDVGYMLNHLIPFINSNSRSDWISRINQIKAQYPNYYQETKDIFYPANLIHVISTLVEPDTIITTDVGQHQMWVAQTYPFQHPRTLLTSGGLGTMGFGLPAAIGAALTNNNKRVVCISGDGSILMNIQELATLADLNLNVTIIIMNNRQLGLVRQQQELFYEKNYFASKFETNPDFCAIGRGFGIRSYDLDGNDKPIDILIKSLKEFGPSIVNVPIHDAENVLPIVPPGAANREMIGVL